jgi:hypothetical protein
LRSAGFQARLVELPVSSGEALEALGPTVERAITNPLKLISRG